MATRLLYQEDSYLREFNARVTRVDGRAIVLDQTAFHPTSGGVDHDTGIIIYESNRYRVVDVKLDRSTGDVLHIVEQEPDVKPGDIVRGIIDWNRRYRLMRLHTAAHIISAIMYRDYRALITGGHVYPDYARDDFSIERFDRRIFEDAIAKANEVVKQGLEVKIYWISREEAMKIPGVVKLAERMPPEVEKLRIVEIPGIDVQADGGPHVRNTREVGEIVLMKVENRGRRKKRVYYTVRP